MEDTTTTHTPPASSSSSPGIRWDDLTIDRESAHLPEDLRDGYRYLKCFARDQCVRDLDVLVAKFRDLGIYHDRTLWSKILRGFWNRNARNEPLEHPVLAREKLDRAIESLRKNVRAESRRGLVPFVTTPTAQSIFDYIDIKRSAGRLNRFGIIVGHTGTGKTAAFREYHRRNNHGSTWWFEAPASGTLGEFMGRMAACSGISEQTGIDKKRAHLLRVIRPDKCIIVDNAQDLYREGKTAQPIFSYLRQLQDETECCIILSITPTFERQLVEGLITGYFEQFEGRSGGRRKWLRLPPYPTEEDCVAIAEAFGIRDAKRHLRDLVEMAKRPGRIRPFFDDLQDAKRIAGARKEALTWDHVVELLED